MRAFQFGMWNSYYGSYRINSKHLMYPRWTPAVQNMCSIKIPKSASMWEEIEAFVNNWEASIPQSVAIAAVKASQNALHLWLLTAYEVSWNFVQYFRTYRQNNISSVFTFAAVVSYHIQLHIKMVAFISQVSQIWMQISWEPEVILKNCQPCSFQFYQKFMEFFCFFFIFTLEVFRLVTPEDKVEIHTPS